jgi:hypothetical protein
MDLGLVIAGLLDNILSLVAGGGDLNITFMRVLRVLRVTKLFRTTKVLKHFSEMRLLIDMLTESATHLFWAMVLMIFILCLFSLFFVQSITSFLNDNGDMSATDVLALESSFGTVVQGMFSLIQTVTGGVDWMETYGVLQPTGQLNGTVFVLFVLFFFFSVFNIVTSVFVDKTMRLALPDIETMVFERQQEEMEAADGLLKFLKRSSRFDDNKICFERFVQIMEVPKFRTYFQFRGVEVKDMHTFFMLLSHANAKETGDEGVSLEEFVHGCMRLKGQASAIDLQSLAHQVRLLQESQRHINAMLHQKLEPRLEVG